MPLSEHHRRHIIELLEQGQDIPQDYKHLLFPPERQEYELVYAGKEREEDILAETMAVPLQPVKTFGGNGVDWHNMLIFGDNLQAMKTLLQWKTEGRLVNPEGSRGVKLVYIDPPFATKQEFSGSQDERAYQDKVVGAQFIEFLRKRLIIIREILSDDGVLFVHLDYRKSHYLKLVLDEIFGESNFRNEIIVKRITKNLQRQFDKIENLPQGHDVLFWYSKRSTSRFQSLLVKHKLSKKEGYWKDFWSNADRPTMRYTLLGVTPETGQWKWSQERAEIAVANYKEWKEKFSHVPLVDYWRLTGAQLEFIRKSPTGKIEHWIAPSSDKLADTIWTDISAYQSKKDYPTQKNEDLLFRIIDNFSSSGDIVLDAFAGSGTTLAVAEKLGRRWIGIDCGKLAIYTIQKRMLTLRDRIGNKGKPLPPRPFTLYNAGLYDFSQLKRLPWEEWRRFGLLLFQCRDEPHTVGGVQLDGYRGADDVLVFNHLQHGGVVLDYGFIDDLHVQIGGKVGARFFIIAPAASVTFLEDYIDKGSTRYYILRIPYSIINELHSRDFETIIQPVDESKVNEMVEAVGFDFIRLPEVECEYRIAPREGQRINEAVIQIKTFKSRAMVKGATQKGNLETLSMVMVDYDYDGEVFVLDDFFFATDIAQNGWEVRMPLESLGRQVMIIYMDIYGNEYREVKTPADFGGDTDA
ncbi:MAG: site-specific DNA-methyltransferase [Bellilinea sp.]|nr:MAG: site-specific DNA-methyltransferase [Bellilinea sp.]